MTIHPCKTGLLTGALLCGALLCLPLFAQQPKPAKPGAKPAPKKDPTPAEVAKTETRRVAPNPFDKFLALDAELDPKGEGKINWKKIYAEVNQNVDPAKYTDMEVILPLVTGIRIADGVMAVKIRDAELLNQCAEDIETMALKLKVEQSHMQWARSARDQANAGEWPQVFLSLSVLQHRILRKLKEVEPDQSSLLMIGGWMQGVRYGTTGLLSAYTPQGSYLLREPGLVVSLIEMADKFKPEKKNLPVVKTICNHLPKMRDIVNIDIDPAKGRVSESDAEKLRQLAADIVSDAVKSK